MTFAEPIRAFQWDLARQTERIGWLTAQLPKYAQWGYQELYLHLEDAVEYPSVPGVARRGAYRPKELDRLVDAAGKAGIGVVPIVNLLGHTQYLIKVPELRDLNEVRGEGGEGFVHGQVCPVDPRTWDLAEKLIGDMAPFCTAGKMHVGLDESYHLGRHPLSRREIDEIGLAGHFARYAGRLDERVRAKGLRMGYWADMLALLPAAIGQMPVGSVAYDWYYYPFRSLPAVELHNFREYDLAPALKRRGIEYWGCPMSSGFRHEPLPTFGDRLENARSWWRRCRKVGAGGFLVTAWETSRTGAEIVQAVDEAVSWLWNGGGAGRRLPGVAKGPGRRLSGDADRYPYAGYARWENEGGWRCAAGRGDGAQRAKELRYFEALAKRSAKFPPALRLGLRVRRYFAARDAFVARAADGFWELRRAGDDGDVGRLEREAAGFATEIEAGRRAARALWRRTRDPRARGANELVIGADQRNLKAWVLWLRRARRGGGAASIGASPVGGAWQFVCRVHNVAPSLQKVVLEHRAAGGRWEDLHGRFLMEFTSAGARRKANIAHPFAAPLPKNFGELRVAVRGVGIAAVSDALVCDGITERRPLNWRKGARYMLGRPSPARGFPRLDLDHNSGERALRFNSRHLHHFTI